MSAVEKLTESDSAKPISPENGESSATRLTPVPDEKPTALFASPSKRNRSSLEEDDSKNGKKSQVFLDMPSPKITSIQYDENITLPVLGSSVQIPKVSMNELFGGTGKKEVNDSTETAPAVAEESNSNQEKLDIDMNLEAETGDQTLEKNPEFSSTELTPKRKHIKMDEDSPLRDSDSTQITEFYDKEATSSKSEWDFATPVVQSLPKGTPKGANTTAQSTNNEEPIVAEGGLFLDLPSPMNHAPTPDPGAQIPLPKVDLSKPVALTDLFGEEVIDSKVAAVADEGLLPGKETIKLDRDLTPSKSKRKKIASVTSGEEQDFKKSRQKGSPRSANETETNADAKGVEVMGPPEGSLFEGPSNSKSKASTETIEKSPSDTSEDDKKNVDEPVPTELSEADKGLA